jgi:hypothetical protein
MWAVYLVGMYGGEILIQYLGGPENVYIQTVMGPGMLVAILGSFSVAALACLAVPFDRMKWHGVGGATIVAVSAFCLYILVPPGDQYMSGLMGLIQGLPGVGSGAAAIVALLLIAVQAGIIVGILMCALAMVHVFPMRWLAKAAGSIDEEDWTVKEVLLG